MAKPKAYNSKQITQHLREIAAMAHDWSEEDGMLTKGECLAMLLWRKALGYTEKVVDDEGNEKEIFHKPEAWAIQLVYDRMEGKVPQAVTDDETRSVKVKDEVSELAKSRLNAIAAESEALKKKGPPKRKRDAE